MNRLEKVLYIAKACTTGARAGTSRSSDGRLEVRLSRPCSLGNGTNPEQLFAAPLPLANAGKVGRRALRSRRPAVVMQPQARAEGFWRTPMRILLCLCFLFLSSTAFAHTGVGSTSGFVHGFSASIERDRSHACHGRCRHLCRSSWRASALARSMRLCFDDDRGRHLGHHRRSRARCRSGHRPFSGCAGACGGRSGPSADASSNGRGRFLCRLPRSRAWLGDAGHGFRSVLWRGLHARDCTAPGRHWSWIIAVCREGGSATRRSSRRRSNDAGGCWNACRPNLIQRHPKGSHWMPSWSGAVGWSPDDPSRYGGRNGSTSPAGPSRF
jgi:hypothetical protein